MAVSPSTTSAAPGMGSMAMPAMTETKIAKVRQPWGVTWAGRGTTSAMARKSSTRAARRPRRIGAPGADMRASL